MTVVENFVIIIVLRRRIQIRINKITIVTARKHLTNFNSTHMSKSRLKNYVGKIKAGTYCLKTNFIFPFSTTCSSCDGNDSDTSTTSQMSSVSSCSKFSNKKKQFNRNICLKLILQYLK